MSMVLAYHLILTAYGFWLPNEPRGSWSEVVRAWELLKYGPATKVDTHRSVARRPYDKALKRAMQDDLARPPVVFTGEQARAIARGFARFVERSGLIVYACAILPDHVHLVVARHRYKIEKAAELLKGDASHRLKEEGLHPFAGQPYRNGRLPTPWARHTWKVFLYDTADIRRSITYAENNPEHEGLRPQRWGFVVPFEPLA